MINSFTHNTKYYNFHSKDVPQIALKVRRRTATITLSVRSSNSNCTQSKKKNGNNYTQNKVQRMTIALKMRITTIAINRSLSKTTTIIMLIANQLCY